MRYSGFFLLFVLGCCLFFCGTAWSGEKQGGDGASSAAAKGEEAASSHVTVAAERMEMLLGQIIKLDGDVLVEDDRYTLTCEHGLIYLRQDGEKKPEEPSGDGAGNNVELDRIEATGRVMVRTRDGSQSATGDRARYDRDAERITLEGNCTILADGRVMRSARVVYDVKSGKISSSRTSITIPVAGGSGKGGDALGGLFGGDRKQGGGKADDSSGNEK